MKEEQRFTDHTNALPWTTLVPLALHGVTNDPRHHTNVQLLDRSVHHKLIVASLSGRFTLQKQTHHSYLHDTFSFSSCLPLNTIH